MPRRRTAPPIVQNGSNGADVAEMPCARCGVVTPIGNQCAKCGKFLSGNDAALTHGLRRYYTRDMIPAELKAHVEDFRANLLSDQGGREDLSTIRAGLVHLLVDCEVGRHLLMQEVARQGITTRPGRAAYDRLLSTIDRWQRLAEKLGLDRRTKSLNTIEDYLRQHASEPIHAPPLQTETPRACQ